MSYNRSGSAAASTSTARSGRGTLLTRVHDELTGGRGGRRCPRCGQPIRAGQRVTAIFGTSVHVGCGGTRAPVGSGR